MECTSFFHRLTLVGADMDLTAAPAARAPRSAADADRCGGGASSGVHGGRWFYGLAYRSGLCRPYTAERAAVLCALLQLALRLGQFESPEAHLRGCGAQRSRVMVTVTATTAGTGATGPGTVAARSYDAELTV